MNKLFDFSHPLTNIELEQIASILKIKLIGVYMKDELPPKLKQGGYIVNLQSSNESGSHWCCFVKTKDKIYWFDPFGQVPPEAPTELFDKLELDIMYSNDHIQDVNSILCGYFCLGFLKFVQNHAFENWNNLFNYSNQKLNDDIIKKYIKQYI